MSVRLSKFYNIETTERMPDVSMVYNRVRHPLLGVRQLGEEVGGFHDCEDSSRGLLDRDAA
jgi:hypothetical protein